MFREGLRKVAIRLPSPAFVGGTVTGADVAGGDVGAVGGAVEGGAVVEDAVVEVDEERAEDVGTDVLDTAPDEVDDPAVT